MDRAYGAYRRYPVLQWGLLALTLVVLALLATRLLSSMAATQEGRLVSASMLPTIPVGATITYDPAPATFMRGEVVVLGLEHGADRLLASRIVGLPGETVEIRDGRLFINGQANDPAPGVPMPSRVSPLHLGPDQYYLLGDNRAAALDSRALGPVARTQILGVLLS
ncbi:MAG TPA: signal peptidase I [Chloroflexota bacterium]|jgi:signal peptidase I